HFLFGSEDEANQLLKLIDAEKSDMLKCPFKVLNACMESYSKGGIYKSLIDEMIAFLKEKINVDEVDYISGGERRDWFFSLVIADILGKPHISIFKDLKYTVTLKDNICDQSIEGGNVLHIADLITEASSYERAWIPAIKGAGANLKHSLVVVDRKQGGTELLEGNGINSFSMVEISKDFFTAVHLMGIINKKQYQIINDYIDNPKDSMRRFMIEHPEFLENSLASDEKTAQRARLCVEKNFYDL
ncbi:MAG TPA: orotate phosphoribosyltransferase, partial [Clostridia bacterium]